MGGEITEVFVLSTWRVLKPYRGNATLELLREHLRRTEGYLTLCSTPNERVRTLFSPHGFQPLPRKEHSVVWVLLNLRKLFSVGFQPLARLTADPLAALLTFFQRQKLRSQKKSLSVRRIESAGKEFDLLWQKKRVSFPNTAVRDRQAVEWFCFLNPFYPKVIFGVYEADELLAYAVFQEAVYRGLSILEGLDYWGETDRTAVSAFLEKAVSFALERKLEGLSFPGLSVDLEKELRTLFFLKKRTCARNEYYKPIEGKILLFPTDSYFSYAEGDIAI